MDEQTRNDLLKYVVPHEQAKITEREVLREEYMESHFDCTSYLERSYTHGDLRFTDDYVLWLEDQIINIEKNFTDK